VQIKSGTNAFRRTLISTLTCLTTSAVAVTANAASYNAANDWAFLDAYRAQNASLLSSQQRVVFMGDSITEFWDKDHRGMFANPDYVNRGISGQTTPQMLLRFRQDVIDLNPKAVVILAGTNDIAGNTGPSTPKMIEANIASMAELAQAHRIKVALCLVLPVARYPWAPDLKPVPEVAAVNAWIRKYGAAHHLAVIDLFTPMATAEGGLRSDYSGDGVHPNLAGYEVMAAHVRASLSVLLKSR
jgi:lysophospholipase L1-like esterase